MADDKNFFDQYDEQGGQKAVLAPGNPLKPRIQQQEVAGNDLRNTKTAQEIQLDRDNYTRNVSNDRFGHVTNLSGSYNQEPAVKSYRVSIGQLAQALGTGTGPQADLALTYAFAKAMDPDSVVRDSEQHMVTDSQPWFSASVERIKKQFGMDGAGQFTPEARDSLRKQIINSVAQRAKVYDARRDFYTAQAKELGVSPDLVVGQHDAEPFIPALEKWNKVVADREKTTRIPAPGAVDVGGAPRGGYDQSVASQGLSGVNEGLAGVAGLPVDLATGALNLIPRGINALANTDLPTIQNPVLGSGWIKDRMGDIGAIGAPAATPQQQFVRRVGESVGASAIPAGMAGTAARAGGQLLAGLGGGLGGASAQRAFPGNPIAELGGELAGGGAAGLGALNFARRKAAQQVAEAVPTIPQLKEQAGDLYRSAEARGIHADPTMTGELADRTRGVLAGEGLISPTGRLSEVYPKAREGMQLIDDYSGVPMSPTQMQTVRKVITDGLSSTDRTDRRLSGLLTDEFDNWARPLAPELDQARNVASRYLTAEQLERARNLAGAKASQFSGSGFENALRTEYRALDRGAIKGQKHFSDDVTNAIENVSRGTPGSNFARNLGKLAPTGAVSFGLGSGLPGLMAGMATSDPVIGGATMLGATALGTAGRAAATGMGIRNADIAELVARNGGALPETPLLPPELLAPLAYGASGQGAKYLPEDDKRKSKNKRKADPRPLAR